VARLGALVGLHELDLSDIHIVELNTWVIALRERGVHIKM
jgi:hypothetical protein